MLDVLTVAGMTLAVSAVLIVIATIYSCFQLLKLETYHLTLHLVTKNIRQVFQRPTKKFEKKLTGQIRSAI